MNETLKTFLIALATSVTVLFVLGPFMMRLQGTSAPPPDAAAPTTGAAPVQTGDEDALTTPNLEGLTISDARDKYRSQGITIIEEGQRADPGAKPGAIIQQNPSGGAPLVQPEIRVTVAKESEKLTVPDVVGLASDKAVADLVAAGFDVPDPTTEASDKPGGTVINQDPAAETEVEEGSTVTLTVAEGASQDLVEVPKLTRKPLSAAKKALTEAGLEVGKVSKQEHEEWSSRKVISQFPKGGEMVAPGTKVNLVIVAPD